MLIFLVMTSVWVGLRSIGVDVVQVSPRLHPSPALHNSSQQAHVERKILETLEFANYIANRAFEALASSSIFSWHWVQTMLSSVSSLASITAFYRRV
jgi:hypothetical protein